MTASISLPNHDGAYTAAILNEGIRDIPVNIYQLYGDTPFAADDAEHLFAGYIDSVPALDDYVTIALVSDGVRTALTPRIRLSEWLGDDMPVPGTRITWGGDTLILESR